MYRRNCAIATVLFLVAMLTPAFASSAWRPLPGFAEPGIAPAAGPFWHQGELHLLGATYDPKADVRARWQPALYLWRAGRWNVVREFAGGSPAGLASDGTELVVVLGNSLHRLRNGQWRDEAIQPAGGIETVAAWRGLIVATGDIGVPGARERPGIVAWDGRAWAALGGGVGGVPLPRVNALLTDGEAAWVAGRFELAGDLPAGNVARWDGAHWDDLDGGADGEILALAHHDGGIAVAGTFTVIGGVACRGLALWRDGAWRPVPALPVPTPFSNRSCPLPTVNRLVSAREGLLALGRFMFVDADGDTARDAAVLADGRWRRWRHQRALFGPDQPEPLGSLPRRRLERIRAVAGEGGRLAFRGAGPNEGSLVALVDEDVAWVVHPYLATVAGIRLAAWRDNLLLLGSQHIGDAHVGGLGRFVSGSWEPVGDWLGPDGKGGGAVQSVAEWQGRLVVAGVIRSVAGRPARHVAAFDGQVWDTLGGGLPTDTLSTAQLLPRPRDLVVITATQDLSGRTAGRFWRWDGSAWSPIALPPALSRTAGSWQAIAGGDTIWLTAAIQDPAKRDDRWSSVGGLFALVDTTWTLVNHGRRPWPWDLAHWNGALHGIATDESGQVRTFVRWDGQVWAPTGAPDLPVEESGLGLSVMANGRLLIGGRARSWCREGAESWASWPDLPDGGPLGAVMAGGHLYRLNTPYGHVVEIWDGALAEPTPEHRPASPTIEPWRRPGRVPQPGLPPLAECAPTDSLCGWYLWDDGGTAEPARARPRGRSGIELEGRKAQLIWQFGTEASRWYRLTGQARTRSGRPSLGMWIEGPRPARGSSNDTDFGKPLRRTVDLDLMLPSPAAGGIGQVSVSVYGGVLRLEDLRLEGAPDFLSEALQHLMTRVQDHLVLRTGDRLELSTAMPSAVIEAARSVFTVTEADSLALTMIAGLGDHRVWVDGNCSREEDHILPGWHQPREPERRSAPPAGSDACERLPGSVAAWLADDLAYADAMHRASFSPDSGIHVPDARTLGARGLVLDLREPSPVRAIDPAHVVAALQGLGAGRLRWARARDKDGDALRWWEVGARKPSGPAPRVADLPIIVLVSGETDRRHALLAEALSRLDNVTLIGETTAPLPAVDVAITIPWAHWKLMVPSGTWEAPGGRALTGTVVAPDIVWPAADTDGLLEQARAVVDAFTAQRSRR